MDRVSLRVWRVRKESTNLQCVKLADVLSDWSLSLGKELGRPLSEWFYYFTSTLMICGGCSVYDRYKQHIVHAWPVDRVLIIWSKYNGKLSFRNNTNQIANAFETCVSRHTHLLFSRQNSKFVEFASVLTAFFGLVCVSRPPSTQRRMCKVPTLFGIIGWWSLSLIANR